MADIVITAGNVIIGSGAVLQSGYANATIAAGQAVYLNTSDNKLYPAIANGTVQQATVAGIALNNAAPGQPVWYITSGPLNVGVVLTAGKIYVLSGAVAGNICPSTDLATGWRTSFIGYASSTSVLNVAINNTGVLN